MRESSVDAGVASVPCFVLGPRCQDVLFGLRSGVWRRCWEGDLSISASSLGGRWGEKHIEWSRRDCTWECRVVEQASRNQEILGHPVVFNGAIPDGVVSGPCVQSGAGCHLCFFQQEGCCFQGEAEAAETGVFRYLLVCQLDKCEMMWSYVDARFGGDSADCVW